MLSPSYSSLDDGLEALARHGIELDNANSNHAPMVIEALCAMGRPDAVMPWISRYRGRLLPRPAASGRILRDDWRPALGERGRFTDWAVFFREELQEAPWPAVLDRWVAQLGPGFCAAATHGVIRVGHAVRSLTVAQTPNRLRELADALASWAATYQELPSGQDPARRPSAAHPMAPYRAIEKVATVPPNRRPKLGNITASMTVLDEVREFGPVIDLLDIGGDLARLVSELTDLFAGVYLANARDPRTTIVFIHGVTSLAALASIIPGISDTTARAAVRYAWQSGCALYARFGSGTAIAAEESVPQEPQSDRLVDRAVAHGDEHVIKFTEACLRRHALGAAPVYIAAVEHALGVIRPR